MSGGSGRDAALQRDRLFSLGGCLSSQPGGILEARTELGGRKRGARKAGLDIAIWLFSPRARKVADQVRFNAVYLLLAMVLLAGGVVLKWEAFRRAVAAADGFELILPGWAWALGILTFGVLLFGGLVFKASRLERESAESERGG